MPTFQRPFDPATVTVSVVLARLPDPPQQPTPGRFARYPQVAIPFVVAEPAPPQASIALSWPATGAVRHVDLPAAEQAALGVTQLIELSPLPFAMAALMRAIAPGAPTFYLGFTSADQPDHDHVARIDDAALDVGRLVLGCVFQDRVSLQPPAWIELIGRALDTHAPADAPPWRSLANLFPDGGGLHLRDAAGGPAAGERVRLRFLDAADNVLRSLTVTSDENGELGGDVLPRPGERAELVWDADALPGDEALPLLVRYEDALGAPADDATRALPGGEPLILPEGFGGGHLQLLDLARWYAPAVPSPGHPWPARFHPGSRFEPLVDGLAAYTPLIEDMRNASGIHLGGWAFHEFPMRPHDPRSSLATLLEDIGRDKFRILVARFFQPKIGVLDSLGTEGVLAAVAAMVAAEPLILTKPEWSDYKGFLVWNAVIVLILAIESVTNPDRSLEDFLRELVEFTDEDVRALLYDVSDGKPHCAFPAPHPVVLADNPLAHDLSLPGLGNISALQEAFGVYHHKFQVIAKQGDPVEPFVGYLGGIDINSNRLDAPGHHSARYRSPDSTAPPGPGAYHDVHARVTGPATLDLIGTFHERYEHALGFSPENVIEEPLFEPPQTPPPPAFRPPTDPIPATGRHLVRIAQTSFKPGPGRDGFPWAPDGDGTIRESFERAIRAAREYIYIEEQYFTLDNPLIEVLRSAADHCRRLVIVVAANTRDQLFGDERRLATLERLAGATGGPGGWGERMVAGSPFRRPVLPPAGFRASVGRASLLEDVPSATTSKIFVGPIPRVPGGAPYFFWVGGELMFAVGTKNASSPGGHPAKAIDVLRGSLSGTSPAWCPHPRPHKRGTPVTFAPPKDIFVHAKLLMVDDVFVAVGSCNWNRRGFYHDGEIDAFAVPERLKAAADNPARTLRTELWAEHLGLPPLMGRSLLADPIAAFELFRRSRYEGNRFAQHREFLAPRGDLDALDDFELFAVLPESVRVTLIATMNAITATQIRNIWNTLVDPTTGLDPNPTEGPELP